MPPIKNRTSRTSPVPGRKEGEWWMTVPDLIQAIRDDLETAGLVGESDAGLLVYLAYSSRLRDRPLSVIVRGPSGSGKDRVERVPAELMPPEDVIDAMSLTPQAFY